VMGVCDLGGSAGLTPSPLPTTHAADIPSAGGSSTLMRLLPNGRKHTHMAAIHRADEFRLMHGQRLHRRFSRATAMALMAAGPSSASSCEISACIPALAAALMLIQGAYRCTRSNNSSGRLMLIRRFITSCGSVPIHTPFRGAYAASPCSLASISASNASSTASASSAQAEHRRSSGICQASRHSSHR